MSEKKHHHHHHKHKESFGHWLKHNWKWLIVLLLLLIFFIAFIIDRNKKDIDINNEEIIVETNNNYDAIITIIDGEGESTFTDTWGELIKEGYPICSTLVTDYVGKDGFMNWDTIKALQNVGVEFTFHSSAHRSYNNMTEKEIISDIERGINAMEEHGIEHRFACWLSGTATHIPKYGADYFDSGIDDASDISAITGDKSAPLVMKNEVLVSNNQYITIEELDALINQAIQNNGWLIIYTRNNANMMDSTQIDIYRQAFEYAKEHNVAVVTASEGYDLYYGNKLGNH